MIQHLYKQPSDHHGKFCHHPSQFFFYAINLGIVGYTVIEDQQNN